VHDTVLGQLPLPPVNAIETSKSPVKLEDRNTGRCMAVDLEETHRLLKVNSFEAHTRQSMYAARKEITVEVGEIV